MFQLVPVSVWPKSRTLRRILPIAGDSGTSPWLLLLKLVKDCYVSLIDCLGEPSRSAASAMKLGPWVGPWWESIVGLVITWRFLFFWLRFSCSIMNLRIGAFLVKSSLLIPESSRSLSMLCNSRPSWLATNLCSSTGSNGCIVLPSTNKIGTSCQWPVCV